MTLKEMVLSFCVTYGCAPVVPYTDMNAKYLSVLEQIAENPSREAALTEQESGWNPNAKSAYAEGLRQFTPATGKWAASTLCKDLGSYAPFNAMWSLRCGVRYVEWLEAKKPYGDSISYCLNRRIAEQRYNGGSWILRELQRANTLDLSIARGFCYRKPSNCDENYNYPKKIDKKQGKYITKGLKGKQCPKPSEDKPNG